MKFSTWIALPAAWLVAAPALAGSEDASKQIVISGGVTVPPPPTVIVNVPPPPAVIVNFPPPPAVVVTPVPPEPVPQPGQIYVGAPPVYVQQAPVYALQPEQPEEDSLLALTVNPIWFWFGNVHAKIGVADWVALNGQFDYTYINFLGWKMWMLGVTVGVDIFFTGRAPEGPFLGPRVGFDHFDWTDSGGGVEVIRAGLAGGYQWIFNSGFALLLGGSLAYIVGVGGNDVDSWLLDWKDLGIPVPMFDIGLGFGT